MENKEAVYIVVCDSYVKGVFAENELHDFLYELFNNVDDYNYKTLKDKLWVFKGKRLTLGIGHLIKVSVLDEDSEFTILTDNKDNL